MDFVELMEKKGRAPQYIEVFKKAVKSWMEYNDIELKRKIRIKNIESTPTLENERVPTKPELDQILSSSNLRTKVIVSLISQAGLRPESVGNYKGNDGIRLGDIPELQIVGNGVSFSQIPARLVVRNALSKAGHRYFTFITKQGCDFIKAYLEGRLALEEALDESSALVAVMYRRERKGKPKDSESYDSAFIQTRNISDAVREAMRPRFVWRPYVLRSYFDTQLLQAESHGEIPNAYRKFFMGHKGDIEARYTTNKGRLPDGLIEDMRRCFTQSQKYLESVERESVDKKQILLEMWKEQAKLYGINPAEILKERQKVGFSLEEMIEAIKSELRNTMRGFSYASQPYKSKIVGEQEMVKLVGEGWDLVKELNNGKFLVRCPRMTV